MSKKNIGDHIRGLSRTARDLSSTVRSGKNLAKDLGMDKNNNTARSKTAGASTNKSSQSMEITEWKCACGESVTNNFCMVCGAKKPVCKKCGELVAGAFCGNCGQKNDK